MPTIAINQINLNAPTQLRLQGESQHHIEELAFAYAENGFYTDLPEVGHIREDDTYVPIDGFHRLHAIKWLGSEDFKKIEEAPKIGHLDLEKVEVKILEFATLADAIIAAAGVNASHGLQRKKGDIKNAIEVILEVEPMRFMDGKYKLNKSALMAAVNCSERTYRMETSDLRAQLKKKQIFAAKQLLDEGKSIREVGAITGMSVGSVQKLSAEEDQEGVQKRHDAKNEHPEEVHQEDQEGVQKRHDAKNEHPEEASEEEPTVFTHITSATAIDCPWDDEEVPEGDLDLSKGITTETKADVEPKSGMSDLELCQFLDSLSAAQQELARNYLENM